MDGLTIRNSQTLLETGKTSSEIRNSQFETKATPADGSEKSFADTLKDAVGQVNDLHRTADKKMQELATGKTSNVSEVLIASEKADIAFKLMTQVRNKIIDAYNEVMKMQV